MHIAHANAIETARPYHRPILEIGPAVRHSMDEFFKVWIATGLPLSKDHAGCIRTGKDMIAFLALDQMSVTQSCCGKGKRMKTTIMVKDIIVLCDRPADCRGA